MRIPSLALIACCTSVLLLGCTPRDGVEAPDALALEDTATHAGEGAQTSGERSDAIARSGSSRSAGAEASAADASALPSMVVYKSPTCGCCVAWADKMREAGFAVEVRDTTDMNPIKQALGVPGSAASCHTAEVDGYFVEGHVPAEDIRRLLAERPDAKGIAVPGMPLGSPGMEVPSGETQPYQVLLIGKDGERRVFAEHGN